LTKRGAKHRETWEPPKSTGGHRALERALAVHGLDGVPVDTPLGRFVHELRADIAAQLGGDRHLTPTLALEISNVCGQVAILAAIDAELHRLKGRGRAEPRPQVVRLTGRGAPALTQLASDRVRVSRAVSDGLRGLGFDRVAVQLPPSLADIAADHAARRDGASASDSDSEAGTSTDRAEGERVVDEPATGTTAPASEREPQLRRVG